VTRTALSHGRRRAPLAAVAVLVLLAARGAGAIEIGAANLLELRAGADPDDARAASDRFTRFEQLDLDALHGPVRLGFRFESFAATDDTTSRFHYDRFVRRFATFSSSGLEITAGNYEALFGRGILLRAFQLPGVVREELGTPQFGDLRDLDGVRVRGFGARWEAMFVHGRPRYSDQEPTERRFGTVHGATAAVEPLTGVRAGANYLRIEPQLPVIDPTQDPRPEGGGVFVGGDWDAWLEKIGLGRLGLSTFAEYARVHRLGLPPSLGSPEARTNEGYGLYVSQSAILRDLLPDLVWGTSYEYKDYQNLALGVNEPPTAVREHGYALLNRTTHVVELQQERGWQVESRFAYRRAAEVVLELSRAENAGSDRFREAYLEVTGRTRGVAATAFAAQQQDESVAVHDRDTVGFAAQVPLGTGHGLELDLERQEVRRRAGALEDTNEDRYASLLWSWAGRLSLAVVRQTTDDRAETRAGRRAYDSLTASIPIGSQHEAALFWGRRRSGLACTSGTCYKVRAFEGVAARLASRF
jgi:hypothetical protein